MDNQPTPTAKPSIPNHHLGILGLLVALMVFAGSTYLLHQRLRSATTPVASQQLLTSQEYDTQLAHPNATFNLVVNDTKLVGGPANIHVKKGDSVHVNIRAGGSKEVRVKLDGYDII